jgi:DNA-binding XRE family transcriptional regulator
VDCQEFSYFRKSLNKTQEEMARLLGSSLRAVHSYEQGWRSVPPHVERQVLLLVSRKLRDIKKPESCWVTKKCPPERKDKCPAWEFQSGDLCWFINGTICDGIVQENWKEKMNLCRDCEVFQPLLKPKGS